jgi:hypothetical protein
MFAGYDACVDWSAAYYCWKLTAFYSDAKVLLSVWLSGVLADEHPGDDFPTLQGVFNIPPGIRSDRREMTCEIITRQTFEDRLANSDYLIDLFNRYIEGV